MCAIRTKKIFQELTLLFWLLGPKKIFGGLPYIKTVVSYCTDYSSWLKVGLVHTYNEPEFTMA